MKFKALFRGTTSAILAVLISTASQGQAQGATLDDLRAAAAAGNSQAQRDLGSALVFGSDGAEQDVAAGLAFMAAAADAGDIEAKAALGKLLLEGYFVPAEPDRGAALLQDAIAAGHVGARTTLGLALLWGVNRGVDPNSARPLLEEAASGGDVLAARVLGQYLLGGWGYDQDVDGGIALLEQAAAAGDAKALVSLGGYHLGRSDAAADRDMALDYFERAAALGNGEGLAQYGSSLMWGQSDPAQAETYLRRAGELGHAAAWTTLASGAMYGYLGSGSRSKYDAYAQLAREAGEAQVDLLDAQRQMWGISMRADGPATLAGLEAAAEAGNGAAASYLIRLVRDGNGLNIRRDRAAARDYLDRFTPLLDAAEIARLDFSIGVASTRIVADFPDLAMTYNSHPEWRSAAFGEDIFKANANFAIYLLQAMMRESGTYNGPLSGMATTSTLRAANSECGSIPMPERCDDSVMRADVIGALITR